MLPDFISNCFLLGAEINYIVPTKKQFQIIEKCGDNTKLLEDIRRESNEQTLLHYDIRMNHIKERMKDRKASSLQWDELTKIENVYLEIKNRNNKNKS